MRDHRKVTLKIRQKYKAIWYYAAGVTVTFDRTDLIVEKRTKLAIE